MGELCGAKVAARLVVLQAYAVDDRDLICTHLSYCVLKSEGEVSQIRPPDQEYLVILTCSLVPSPKPLRATS